MSPMRIEEGKLFLVIVKTFTMEITILSLQRSYACKGCGLAVSFRLPRCSLWCMIDPSEFGLLCLYSWSISDLDSLRSMQMQGDSRAKALCPPRSVRGGLR